MATDLLGQGGLRRALTDHLVATGYEKGWAGLTNGELLADPGDQRCRT